MLFIHDRSERGIQVSPAAEDALRQAFFVDQRSTQHLFVARALLRDLHRDRLWLACDCAGDRDQSPMLGPRAGRTGLHPFRFGALPHAAGCPFSAPIRASTLDDDADDGVGPIPGPWDLAALVPASAPREARASAMNRLLRTALHDLGFDRIHASSFQRQRRGAPLMMIEQPYTRLRHLGSHSMGGSLTFGQVGCTFLPAIKRTYAALQALAPLSQPSPTGLFIGVTDEAVGPAGHSPGYLKAKDAQGEARVVPVLGDMHLPEGDDGLHGPYWTIALIERAGGSSAFRLMEAAAVPASDRRTLVPLPDRHYRPLVQVLLEQMAFWRHWPKLSLDVELEMELFQHPDSARAPITLSMPGDARLSLSMQDEHEADLLISAATTIDDGLRRRLTAAVALAAETSSKGTCANSRP